MATTRSPGPEMADSNKRPRSPEKSERDYDSTKRRRKDENGGGLQGRDGARHDSRDSPRAGERQGQERRERDDHDGGRDGDRRGEGRRDKYKRRDDERKPENRRDREARGDHRNGERSNRDARATEKPSTSTTTTKLSSRQKDPTVNGGDAMDVEQDSLDPEDKLAGQLKRLMGFSNFRSTKNTKVPGNDKNYAVRKEKKTEYRQYMNRLGGFNRPLSPSR